MPWKKGNRLKLVSEDQAQGRTAEIFEEIKQALGIPQVNVAYEAFANYPLFLDLHWHVLQRVVETQEFFALADRLRADAYTRVHSYFDIPDLCTRAAEMNFSIGARMELTDVVDLWHYCEPVFLLMIAAQFQIFESSVGRDGGSSRPASHPVFSSRPIVINEEIATQPTRAILEEFKRMLRLPFVPIAYQCFARWPDFLKEYWQGLKAIVQSPVYEGCHYGVRETAFALTREFPLPVELTVTQLSEAGMKDDDIASVVRITELLVNALSGMTLNVAYAKISLEGGSRHVPSKEKITTSTGGGKTEQAA